MDKLLIYAIFVSQGGGMLVRSLELALEVPVPWAMGAGKCKVTDSYFQDDPQRTTLCDPDETLLPLDRMITNDMLQHCRDYSCIYTTFFLLLANNITDQYTLKANGKTNSSVPLQHLQQLMEKGVSAYNLTSETSAIFLAVTKEPFQVKVWVSDSLSSYFPPSFHESAWRNVSQEVDTSKHFPTAVNNIILSYCQRFPYASIPMHKWDIVTLVVVLISAAIIAVTHLIIIRCIISNKKNQEVEVRVNPGRPSFGPLSMQMDDFGTIPFQPSENLLLSTLDVTATMQQPQQTASTANLLES